jgi:hypothetical protein
MNVFKTPRSARAERKRAERLDIARRLYQALAAQDPDRVITLCDGGGRVVARHDSRLSRMLQRFHPTFRSEATTFSA